MNQTNWRVLVSNRRDLEKNELVRFVFILISFISAGLSPLLKYPIVNRYEGIDLSWCQTFNILSINSFHSQTTADLSFFLSGSFFSLSFFPKRICFLFSSFSVAFAFFYLCPRFMTSFGSSCIDLSRCLKQLSKLIDLLKIVNLNGFKRWLVKHWRERSSKRIIRIRCYRTEDWTRSFIQW